MLSLAMSLLYFRWVRDSQSGMWVFRRSILKDMKLVADGMAFSEEIKIEALKRHIRFAEISIMYTSRLGEIKLNPWRDGFYNLWFLIKKRFHMSVAAVVPHWNRRDLLGELLSSMRCSDRSLR